MVHLINLIRSKSFSFFHISVKITVHLTKTKLANKTLNGSCSQPWFKTNQRKYEIWLTSCAWSGWWQTKPSGVFSGILDIFRVVLQDNYWKVNCKSDKKLKMALKALIPSNKHKEPWKWPWKLLHIDPEKG